jgi:hypothetical protein
MRTLLLTASVTWIDDLALWRGTKPNELPVKSSLWVTCRRYYAADNSSRTARSCSDYWRSDYFLFADNTPELF